MLVDDRSYLEAPEIDLTVETVKVTMAEVLVQHMIDQQLFVFYLPSPPVRHPTNDMLICRVRNDLMKPSRKVINVGIR